MSEIICAASSFSDVHVASLISISTSFQAALTPWLSTAIANDDQHWYFSELNLLALSPTFQFTRDLAFDANKELLKSAIFSPLYSHLKSLHIVVEGKFDFGVETANLVLRFQRLQKFQLYIDDILTADPGPLIHVIETLLARKTHFSNNFVVTFIKFSLLPWFEEILRAIGDDDPQTYLPKYPIITLLKDKNIALLLQDRMLDLYKQDHGESLVVFFNALEMLTRVFFSIPHSLDEMCPTLDLIEQIVLNGDLLNSSRHVQPLVMNDEKVTEEELESSKRWNFAREVIDLFWVFERYYDSSDFVERYYCPLLPAMLTFLMSNYDQSYAAVLALDKVCSLYHSVVSDHHWADELHGNSPIAGIEKMTKNGRGLSAHMPFDEMAFMLEECCKHLPGPDFAGGFSISGCLEKARDYVGYIEAAVYQMNQNVGVKLYFIEDLVVRFNNKNLLLHFFSCLEKNFETTSKSTDDRELRKKHLYDLKVFNQLISCSDFLTPSEGKPDLEYEKTHRFVDGNRNEFFKDDSEKNDYCTTRRVLDYAKRALSDVEQTTAAYSHLFSNLSDTDWSHEILAKASNLCGITDKNIEYVWAVERLLWITLRQFHESMNDELEHEKSSGVSARAKKKVLFVEIRKTARRATEIGVEAREIAEIGRTARDERRKLCEDVDGQENS